MRSNNQQRQARSALLGSRARRMLHAPTASDEALWQALRGGALGVAFNGYRVVRVDSALISPGLEDALALSRGALP